MNKKTYTWKPYREKTAAINQFLQMTDWEPDRKKLQKLDIASWHSYLRSLNEQFWTVYFACTALLSGIAPGAAHNATGKVFVKLCEILNALALVNGETAYKSLIDPPVCKSP